MIPLPHPQTAGLVMAGRGKILAEFDEAVHDIPDGATVAVAGFAGLGMPFNLLGALLRQGAKDLVLVANSVGGSNLPPGAPTIERLVLEGRVRKVIASFTAARRASQRLGFTELYEAGRVEAELCPQGTLAERLRAAGAGIPAFYTPAGVGTDIAAGKEARRFAGREFLLETALPIDYALIRAFRADAFGNLQYRRAQRQFAPLMAMAARTVLVEVEEEFVPEGGFDPDHIHTPGILVHRMLRVPPPPSGWWPFAADAAS
jgi:3-oxoadipate CoA-transferase alpha subunit